MRLFAFGFVGRNLLLRLLSLLGLDGSLAIAPTPTSTTAAGRLLFFDDRGGLGYVSLLRLDRRHFLLFNNIERLIEVRRFVPDFFLDGSFALVGGSGEILNRHTAHVVAFDIDSAL